MKAFLGNREWMKGGLIFGALVFGLGSGTASAQTTLRQSNFTNGEGRAHLLRDSATSGATMTLSGSIGGAAPVGVLTSGTTSVRSRSDFRMTSVVKLVEEFDNNGDGNIDRLAVTFESAIRTQSINNSGAVFRIDGINGVGTPVLSNSNKTATFSFTGLSGTERKTVRYTAAQNLLTDSAGTPVLFWPATGRKTTLCGVVDAAHQCIAQVERDKADPVLTFTSPDPFDTVSNSVRLDYQLSETVKTNANAPVAFLRVRGMADAVTHTTNLGTQTTKGTRNITFNGGTLGLVEGAGYRITTNYQDNADVGDPYTATNTNSTVLTNIIYGRTTGSTFVYVQAGAPANGTGTATSPFSSIPAAIAALPGAGGNVLVLDGTYTGPFTIPSNVEVRGVGADATILRATNGCVLVLDRVQNVELTGLRIEGGTASAGAALDDAGICIYAGSGHNIHNNVVTAGKTGVRIESSGSRFNRNTVVRTTTHGVMLHTPQDGSAQPLAEVMSNVVVAPTGGTCVYLEVPSALAGDAETVVHDNILFPANCASVSSRAAIALDNTFTNPNLNSFDVATANGTTTSGWNTGGQGVLDVSEPEEPPPPTVSAMNSMGLILGMAVALLVASAILKRRKP